MGDSNGGDNGKVNLAKLDLKSIISLITIGAAIVGSYIQMSVRMDALEFRVAQLIGTPRVYTKDEIDTWRAAGERTHEDLYRRIENLENQTYSLRTRIKNVER